MRGRHFRGIRWHGNQAARLNEKWYLSSAGRYHHKPIGVKHRRCISSICRRHESARPVGSAKKQARTSARNVLSCGFGAALARGQLALAKHRLVRRAAGKQCCRYAGQPMPDLAVAEAIDKPVILLAHSCRARETDHQERRHRQYQRRRGARRALKFDHRSVTTTGGRSIRKRRWQRYHGSHYKSGEEAKAGNGGRHRAGCDSPSRAAETEISGIV